MPTSYMFGQGCKKWEEDELAAMQKIISWIYKYLVRIVVGDGDGGDRGGDDANVDAVISDTLLT